MDRRILFFFSLSHSKLVVFELEPVCWQIQLRCYFASSCAPEFAPVRNVFAINSQCTMRVCRQLCVNLHSGHTSNNKFELSCTPNWALSFLQGIVSLLSQLAVRARCNSVNECNFLESFKFTQFIETMRVHAHSLHLQKS